MEYDITLWNRYSDVEEIPVQWLWFMYIAIGKSTLLQRVPGDGKLNLTALDIVLYTVLAQKEADR